MATPIPGNHAAFTRAELLLATSGELAGAVDHVVGVSTDTRAVTPGAVFVALRGEVHDGHAHLAQAQWEFQKDVDAVYPALAASVLSLVVISYLTPKPSDEKLKPFFE